ncbi:MAG: hypothetical protein K2P77_09860, partial [Burkholderiaceae bacterium]|nr:hypothetical protein [Burkholderiaceae bacterium]
YYLRTIAATHMEKSTSKTGALNAVAVDGGMSASAMAAANGRPMAVTDLMFFIFIPFSMKIFNRIGGTGQLVEISRKHGTSAPPASQWGRVAWYCRSYRGG